MISGYLKVVSSNLTGDIFFFLEFFFAFVFFSPSFNGNSFLNKIIQTDQTFDQRLPKEY